MDTSNIRNIHSQCSFQNTPNCYFLTAYIFQGQGVPMDISTDNFRGCPNNSSNSTEEKDRITELTRKEVYNGLKLYFVYVA